MADFNTHIAGAALATGLLSTACVGADVVNPADAVALWAVGTLGGVLPDIDSDHSHALRLVFGMLGVGAAAAALMMLADHLTIVELWITCCLLYLAVRHGLSRLFAKLTVHRGVFHSLLASGAMALTVVHLGWWVGGRGPLMAWMMGFFAFVGCLVHLLLDEMYSVDLIRQQIKRSFGTAFKMFDRRSPKASLGALLAVIALSWTAPSAELFARFLLSAETYQRIGQRLWPESGWFQSEHGLVQPQWRRVPDVIPTYLQRPDEAPLKDLRPESARSGPAPGITQPVEPARSIPDAGPPDAAINAAPSESP